MQRYNNTCLECKHLIQSRFSMCFRCSNKESLPKCGCGNILSKDYTQCYACFRSLMTRCRCCNKLLRNKDVCDKCLKGYISRCSFCDVTIKSNKSSCKECFLTMIAKG